MIYHSLTTLISEGQPLTTENPAPEGHSAQISTIAYGVAARLDTLYGFSEMITEQSAAIARQMKIPEEDIKSWQEAMVPRAPERAIFQSWRI